MKRIKTTLIALFIMLAFSLTLNADPVNTHEEYRWIQIDGVSVFVIVLVGDDDEDKIIDILPI